MAQDTQKKAKFPAFRSIPATGNMTRDPREIKGGEDSIGAGFGIAVNSRDYKGNEETEFVDVIIWGYWARAVLDGYKSGERVTVIGDIYFEEYEGKRRMKMEAREISKIIYPPDSNSGGGRSRRNKDDEEGDEGRSSSRPDRNRRGSSSDDDGDERPARRRRSSSDDGDAEERPSRRQERGSSSDDDGDERPARRRRSSNDDDADERPARRRRSSSDDGDDLG